MRYAFAILAALAACSMPTEPEDARQFDPVGYRAWWDGVVACARVSSPPPFEAVRWYAVPDGPDGRFPCQQRADGRCAGLRVGMEVYVAASRLEHYGIIQHEALHVILDDNGHDDPRFRTCAPGEDGEVRG